MIRSLGVSQGVPLILIHFQVLNDDGEPIFDNIFDWETQLMSVSARDVRIHWLDEGYFPHPVFDMPTVEGESAPEAYP